MPVYKLLVEMPYEEMVKWQEYFKQRPIGWREDDRTMKLLQVQGVEKRPYEIFPSLKPIYQPPETSAKAISGLKDSAMFSRMLSAKGGDKLPT